jgi:hypothetical protein
VRENVVVNFAFLGREIVGHISIKPQAQH